MTSMIQRSGIEDALMEGNETMYIMAIQHTGILLVSLVLLQILVVGTGY
jgi:hypothetical protein